MKILAVQTHYADDASVNAADWWRTITPFTQLQKNTDWQIDFRRGVISKEAAKDVHGKTAQEEWEKLGKEYDIVYYSYHTNPMIYSCVNVAMQRYKKALCMDFDDNLLRPDLTNPREIMSRMDNRFHDMYIEVVIEETPFITVTSEVIKKEYEAFLKKKGIAKPIFVLPNYIDLSTYESPWERKKDDTITIGFFGSTSHQADLYEKHFLAALQQIRKKYKQVRFEILGTFVPEYLDNLRVDRMIEGSHDFTSWIQLWKEHVCRWDIGVAPLRNIEFNKSRSNIKFLEYGAASIPMVASDIGLYTDKEVLKAKTTSEWVSHLSELIENKSYREKLGEEAFHRVSESYTIQKNWQKWRDVMQKIATSFCH